MDCCEFIDTNRNFKKTKWSQKTYAPPICPYYMTTISVLQQTYFFSDDDTIRSDTFPPKCDLPNKTK